MSKNRLLSGKKKKLTGADLSAERYDYLDVSNAEPDLGLPPVDNSILIGDLDGSRTWIDIIDYAEEFKGYTGSQGDIGFAGSQGDIGFTGSAGTSGSDGTSGSAGEPGYTGSQGGLGYTGSKGVDGQFGGASFYYIFDSDEYINTVPDGYFRLDTNDTTLVTFVALADTDRFGTNIATFIQTIDDSTSDIKGYIKLTEESNVNIFTIFAIVGVHSTHDDHFHIPISYISGAVSAPLIDTNFIISFTVNGDRGDLGFTGSQGDIGFAGSQGDTGFTGSKGFTGSQGDLGYTGSQGNIGFTGSAGADGTIGTDGADGAIGFTGSRGDVGFTGSAGTDGIIGVAGADGAVGYTGSAGSFTATTELAIVTTNTTESTSTGTGALIVAGGAGIDGNIYFSGNLYKNGVLFTGGGDNTPNAINLFQSGLLTTNPGTTRWYAPYSLVITSIKARVVVVADNDIVISINKNNTSEQTVTILANAVDAAAVTEEIYLDYEDFLTVAVTQVGSALQPGADLYVQFIYQYLPA